MAFVHLHNHSQYSLLDGACRLDKMLETAKNMGMSAVAMTDHGNMFGAIEFYKAAHDYGIKPIIGFEAYVINDDDEKQAGTQTNYKNAYRYHLVLLAKNLAGYKNIIKLSGKSWVEGFYYKPRVFKSWLKEHAEGVIALSACIQGEVARNLINKNPQAAEKALIEYKEIFGENFYLELQDHGLEEERFVMPQLVELARRTGTKLVVTNDCHYISKEDAEAHDILLCIQTGKTVNAPDRMRFESQELYFKNEAEMRMLFPDVPDAYENTVKIAEEIDLELDYSKFLFPEIEIPREFASKADYMKYLCYENAKIKYPEVTSEVRERIDFELDVIHRMGYEGYFLVVRDFINAARRMDIPVGPGRGSAAGSIVAYLLGITQLCPLKYGLLFERFLDIERVGMPDIDIDFCAEGRARVIDYVVEKYGRQSVAQIVTFGTLKAKSVIKDVARVLEVSASEANQMTKLMPSGLDITLKKAMENKEFSEHMNANDLYKSIVKYGMVLEGLVRQIGVHAAGVVIAPGNLMEYVPLAISKQKGDEDVVLVQYEGKWLDDLKMLKMDFLGLKTLTLINRTTQYVEANHQIKIDINNLPLDDKPSYELLSRGETDGIFQFESAGMKKYLQELKPNVLEDLIAMVALYRPGPMQFIPSFISRKNGKETVIYDHPLAKNALQETYGVTVYQEQVMQISKEMAGFTSAEAGALRKAISKKKRDLMDKMHDKFKSGAMNNGVSAAVVEKIWAGWEDFANYAFNKSHAACYAYVAYQTAYLKAHYPVEFMAALLSLEEDNEKIPYFIEVSKNMGIEVTPPSINKSLKEFAVIEKRILFGLRGIKNVGDAAISSILNERSAKGEFKEFFDFCKRMNTSIINKQVLESLVYAGAMDELPGTRAQKYQAIDIALSEAGARQADLNAGQLSLFDALEELDGMTEHLPSLPNVEDFTLSEKLEKEKSVLGYYVSGHPLMHYKHILELFCNCNSQDSENSEFRIMGIVVKKEKKTNSRGKTFAFVKMEDLQGAFELCLFKEDFENYFTMLEEGKEYFIFGSRSTFKADTEEGILRVIPHKIIPAAEIPDEIGGEVSVNLSEKYANAETASFIKDEMEKNKGKFKLSFKVKTEKFNTLDLVSQIDGFFPSAKFIDQLVKGYECKVNVRLYS